MIPIPVFWFFVDSSAILNRPQSKLSAWQNPYRGKFYKRMPVTLSLTFESTLGRIERDHDG